VFASVIGVMTSVGTTVTVTVPVVVPPWPSDAVYV
jgi:hypothetical protein